MATCTDCTVSRSMAPRWYAVSRSGMQTIVISSMASRPDDAAAFFDVADVVVAGQPRRRGRDRDGGWRREGDLHAGVKLLGGLAGDLLELHRLRCRVDYGGDVGLAAGCGDAGVFLDDLPVAVYDELQPVRVFFTLVADFGDFHSHAIRGRSWGRGPRRGSWLERPAALPRSAVGFPMNRFRPRRLRSGRCRSSHRRSGSTRIRIRARHAPSTKPPNVLVNWVQLLISVGWLNGPFSVRPTKAATAVPTPSMGLEPESVSST